MISFLSRTFNKLEQKFAATHNYLEKEQLVQFVRNQSIGLTDSSKIRILDVGCGFGVNMRALSEAGFINVIGVDANQQTVAQNIENGLDCIHTDSFTGYDFDIMIMSHVIEHMQPENLKNFLDRFLDALKPHGFLIVSTPLIWEGFYQDFDHIKPYYPKGLMAVFDRQGEQIAYYGRNALKLEGTPWVRKMPFLVSGYKYFLLQPFTRTERLLQLCLNVLFYWSPKTFGKPNGWMAVFRKISP